MRRPSDRAVPRKLPFTTREYQRRLEKVQEKLEERNLDALLVFDPVSQNYLTGYETMELTHYRCLVVGRSGPPSAVTSNFERPGVELADLVGGICDYHFMNGDPVEATKRALSIVANKAERIGIEKTSQLLTPRFYEGLLGALRSAVVEDSSDIVTTLRRIKSGKEIEYTRRASKITSLGMRRTVDAIQEGATDFTIAAESYRVMTEAGSEYTCYAPFVTMGRRSGVPHTTFVGSRVRRDDVVFIELGACVSRYSGPLMRTVFLGRVPPEALENARTLTRVLEDVIDSISPGLTCGEVAAKVRRNGYRPRGRRIISPCLIEADYGYGIGLGFPPSWGGDGPLIAPEEQTTLEPGMVFHLNETLREVATYGMSISETVVVTKGGCRVLTEYAREFPRK